MKCSFVFLIYFACLTFSGLGQPVWPQFRGPGARGTSQSDQLPLVWSQTENVAWKTPVPGVGWSSPIVSGDTIYLTSCTSNTEIEAPKKGLYFGGERPKPENDHEWWAFAYQLKDGDLKWKTRLHKGPPPASRHLKNSYASETPVTDGKHVFVLFGDVGIFCLATQGAVVWERALSPMNMRNGWGTSSSPVLYNDVVYLVRDQQDQSELLGLDARNGDLIWRIKRDEPSNFSTPYIWKNPLRTELITTGVNKTQAYDLEGNPLWNFEGMSSIVIPTPFAAHGMLYLAAGYVGDKKRPNKPVYTVKPGAHGDITMPLDQDSSEFIAWRKENAAPYNPSPLVVGEKLYVLWDFGFLSCRNALTGKEIYDKQRFNDQGSTAFTSSSWSYRGRVFCLSEDGDTYVVPVKNTFEIERINSLGEMCMATPAMTKNSLVIRTMKHLYAIRGQK